jgi:hypothetical protein
VLSLQGDEGLSGDSDNDSDRGRSGGSRVEGAGDGRKGQEVKLGSSSGHKKKLKGENCHRQCEGGGSGQDDGRGCLIGAVDAKKRIEGDKEGGGEGSGKGKRGVLPNIMQLRQICDFADFDDLPSDDRDRDRGRDGDRGEDGDRDRGRDRDRVGGKDGDRDRDRYGGGGRDRQDEVSATGRVVGGNGNGNRGVPMGEYVDTLLRHSAKMKVTEGETADPHPNSLHFVPLSL